MVDELEGQLHKGFVGRKALLAELARLLIHESADLCCVLMGEPGVGKTAVVTNWVAQRKAAHDLVFHYFVRRQQGDTAERGLVARTLAEQIEVQFPHLREPFARPEARLGGLLKHVSRDLKSGKRRLVLAIDGLEGPGSGSDLRQVLACLPRGQPSGIRLLLGGGSRDLQRDLENHFDQVAFVDLDEPGLIADNEATVRAFWHREESMLGLKKAFVERAILCAGGNMLHATMLRKHVASVPSQQQPEAIPRDLPSLLATLWQRIASDRPVVRVLETLCAAREPLSLEQIGLVAGWSNPGDTRAAVNLAPALLERTQSADRVMVYGLCHDVVRSFLVEQLGPDTVRAQHGELAERLATWPAPRDVTTRRYALRYAISHLVAAGDCQAIYSRASNIDFLEAKCNELGIDDVEVDIWRAAGACLAAGNMALQGTLERLVRSIASESSPLGRAVGTDTTQLWSRVRQNNRASSPIEQLVPSAPGGGARPVARSAPSRGPALAGALIGGLGAMTPARALATSADQRTQLGLRPASLCGHPALLSKLVYRGGAVTACAVTPDSRCVVAAYSDHSLKAWDIESGRLLRTMNGHRGVVESCAVTPDGRCVVSASADTTLKVWDLKLGALLATFEGHAGSVESCAVTPDGRWVISASADTTLKIWDLKFGILLATLEGHTDSVESCAVTPDGRLIVSGSADTTLKVWDLETCNELATFKGHVESVESCAVTPDGRRVVSGSCDHTLKVWDIDTGTATTLKGHVGPVSCVCVTDSRSVYSASVDTTLGIWDVDTGHRVTAFEGHAGPVTCCVVTPDGRRLISGSPDDTLKVWSLDGTRTSTLPGGVRALPLVAQPTLANASIVRRGRKPPGTKQLILFLAANPKDTNRRVLEEECAAIERELRSSRHGNDFEFRSKWALTVDEMARHLLDLDPAIVHFRGQGRRDSSDPEVVSSGDASPQGDSGIYLYDELHGVQLVTGRALKMMVGNSAPSARVVVLNACYSDKHAVELCQVVECVVGMTRDHHHAARSFAVAFYRALGHRFSVGDAVEHSVATLVAKLVPDECKPRWRTSNWVDPNDIFLI